MSPERFYRQFGLRCKAACFPLRAPPASARRAGQNAASPAPRLVAALVIPRESLVAIVLRVRNVVEFSLCDEQSTT